MKATQAAHQQANKEKINSRRNVYLQRTGKGSETVNRRRARLAQAEGSHTRQEWLALCERYGRRCLGCGASDRPLTRDHVVPLSLGGSDYIENIQPLCRPCNTRKKDKHVDFRNDTCEVPR